MNKREMANAMRGLHLSINVDGHQLSLGSLAADTLEREAEAEEKAKPKVTLEKQIAAIEAWKGCCLLPERTCSCVMLGSCPTMKAVADTLRRLREEGGKLLPLPGTAVSLQSPSIEERFMRLWDFLRSLGVEPKP